MKVPVSAFFSVAWSTSLTSLVCVAQAKAADAEAAYRKDQATMLASFHDLAIKASRDRVLTRAVVSPDEAQRPYQPQSWLSQQRARAQGKGLVSPGTGPLSVLLAVC